MNNLTAMPCWMIWRNMRSSRASASARASSQLQGARLAIEAHGRPGGLAISRTQVIL
jgi:hypothetical protein